jgi:hypothetical protein
LRGGSWNNNHRNARLSDRNNNNPNNSNNNNGFRVLVFHRFAIRRKCDLITVRRRGKIGWPVTRSRFPYPPGKPAKYKIASPIPVAVVIDRLGEVNSSIV